MKVSVVLTSYNHERFIEESIKSILQQTYKEFELIILDDYSTDNSWNIINKFSDYRIKKIRNKKNLRIEGLKRIILEVAKGDLIAIAHSDDVWKYDKLEKQIKVLESDNNIAAVFTHVEVIDQNGNIYEDKESFYYNVFNQKNRSKYEWLNTFFYYGNCLCHPSILIRKNMYVECNMFTFGYGQIPDMNMWIRLCLKKDIFIVEEKLVSFRILDNNCNTSGKRIDTIIRSSIESYMSLSQFLSINHYEEFIKVFPESKKFINKEYFLPQYAFAKICTKKDMPNYTRLYGYELLFQLMQEQKTRIILEEIYNYTFKDLIFETGKYDVFKLLPEDLQQTATLFIDDGNGFSEEKKEQHVYDLIDYNTISISYNVEKYNVIKKLRFDPIENKFCYCELVSVKIDNADYKLHAINQFKEKGIFFTTDPIYEGEKIDKKIKKVEIKMKITILSLNIIENIIERQLNNMNEKLGNLNSRLDDLNNRLYNKEMELKRLKNVWIIKKGYQLKSIYNKIFNK